MDYIYASGVCLLPRSISIKNKITKALELPREIVLDLPLISMVGNDELLIENYRGLIEYTGEKMRINTKAGVVRIEGKNLVLKHITSENVLINGKILRFEFLY